MIKISIENEQQKLIKNKFTFSFGYKIAIALILLMLVPHFSVASDDNRFLYMSFFLFSIVAIIGSAVLDLSKLKIEQDINLEINKRKLFIRNKEINEIKAEKINYVSTGLYSHYRVYFELENSKQAILLSNKSFLNFKEIVDKKTDVIFNIV